MLEIKMMSRMSVNNNNIIQIYLTCLYPKDYPLVLFDGIRTHMTLYMYVCNCTYSGIAKEATNKAQD